MSEIMIAIIVVVLMPGWFAWLCWGQSEKITKMTLRKKIKYAVATIGISFILYFSWNSISEIPWYWRIGNMCLSIFVTILLKMGDVPVRIGMKGFKSKREFLQWYLVEIIDAIPFGILIFSLLIAVSISTTI